MKLPKLVRSIVGKLNPDHIVIVFNGKPIANKYNFDDNVHLINGSNRLLDMSAYYEGYLYADNILSYCPNDSIVFMNDSVFHKHPYNTILRFATNNILCNSKLDMFYCGIPSWVVNNGCRMKYYSTYFIISNFSTIKHISGKLLGSYRWHRKQTYAQIENIFDGSWRPKTQTSDLNNLLRKKKLCIFFEMTISSLSSMEGYQTDFKPHLLIKSLRFFLKAKNFLKKCFFEFIFSLLIGFHFSQIDLLEFLFKELNEYYFF
jgi:hypothetical protein